MTEGYVEFCLWMQVTREVVGGRGGGGENYGSLVSVVFTLSVLLFYF